MRYRSNMPRLPLVLGALALCACPPKPLPPPPPPPERCEVDLAATGLFSSVGTGAHAAKITDAAQLIGGEMAHGQLGDFLIENDNIRAVVQDARRVLGPNPYGGTIIDADLKRAVGQSGHDQM